MNNAKLARVRGNKKPEKKRGKARLGPDENEGRGSFRAKRRNGGVWGVLPQTDPFLETGYPWESRFSIIIRKGEPTNDGVKRLIGGEGGKKFISQTWGRRGKGAIHVKNTEHNIQTSIKRSLENR